MTVTLQSGLKQVKIFFCKRHETESFVFFLQCHITCLILIGFAMAFAIPRILKEEVFTCMSKDDMPTSFINAYCWSRTTFSVKSAYDENRKVGSEIPYPGVDKYQPGAEYIYRGYYGWFVVALLVQGLLFYVPRAIWHGYENGSFDRIASVLKDPPAGEAYYLREPEEDALKEPENGKLQKAAVWLVNRWGWNDSYALWYSFCELLAFINVALQIHFLNNFFHGQFLEMGLYTSSYFSSGYDDNPLARIFPLMTKCMIQRYGSSGDVQRHDAMCSLPLNSLAEKVYLFLWFWFFLLCALSIYSFLETLATFLFPYVRVCRLHMRASNCQWRKLSEVKDAVSDIGRYSSFGDWFVLYSLAQRMDLLDFKMLLMHVKEEREIAKGVIKRGREPPTNASKL